MEAHTCLQTIKDKNRVVKSGIPSQSRELTSRDYNGILVASISWATPGETTQAGIRQGAGGELSKLSAGSSQKLIELPLPRGSLSISGAVRWLLPRGTPQDLGPPGP